MDINLKLKEAEIKLIKENGHLYCFYARKINTLEETEYQEFIDMFNKSMKGKKISVLHSSIEKTTINIDFLKKSNLEFDFGKQLFKKELKNLKPNYQDEFIYKPSNHITENELLSIIKNVVDKNELEGSASNFLAELKEIADFNYDEKKWKLVYKKNDLIGVVFPQLYPDDSKEGTLLHIGLLPEYRNLGYGRIIHSKGIEFLKEFGADTYIGSTNESNIPMLSLFVKNNCELSYYQFYYNNKC